MTNILTFNHSVATLNNNNCRDKQQKQINV